MPKPFQEIGGLRPGRSVFDLSYEKKFTCDMGMLIPVIHDVMIPGDVFEVGVETLVRVQPMVAPLLHEMNIFVHLFFVPNRLLEDDWEEFISGGADGASAATIGTWSPADVAVESLWDYMGFPVGVTPDADSRPLDLPKRAYNLIYNEYYRDQDLTSAVNIETSEDVLYRCWEKDYFTSAKPWQQRGTSPALPVEIAGNGASFMWYNAADATERYVTTENQAIAGDRVGLASQPSANGHARWSQDPDYSGLEATSIEIADWRLSHAIQQWMELNARAGVRYTEFLRAHYGVSPKDMRLQRPEFIGGCRTPIIVSEVLQTESSDASTAQGTMAGHGISADRNMLGKYRAEEFGILMGILSIMPKPLYEQGINRQWYATTRYDWPFPEFANLSEQAILQREIFLSGVKGENETVFGYQGKDDHHRYKPSMVCGKMRDSQGFDYWHASRQFAVAPTLVTSFVECSSARDDFLAVPSEPAFLVSVGNSIRAVRPLPLIATPGYPGY